MKKQTKAVGYIRVSTPDQAADDKVSLEDQGKKIQRYCEMQGWTLVEIYDEGAVSGKTMEDRPEFLRMMQDAQEGRFQAMIVWELDRYGRTARDIYNNINDLLDWDIKPITLKELYDFTTDIGRNVILPLLAWVAEKERKTILERTMQGRYLKAKKGDPRAGIGAFPFGRIWDGERFVLEHGKANMLRKIAERYLEGESLTKMAKEHGLNYSSLIRNLTQAADDKWIVTFKDEDKESLTFEIPKLLDDVLVQAVKDRLEHRHIAHRPDAQYPLTGFVRCMGCGKNVVSMKSSRGGHKNFAYYRHYTRTGEKASERECQEFRSVNMGKLEQLVFESIFKNTYDEPSFNEAIKKILPDEKYQKELAGRIVDNEKKLTKKEREYKRLVDKVIKGVLDDDDYILGKKTAIKEEVESIESELTGDRDRLSTLPKVEVIEKEARMMRQAMLDYFGSEDRMQEMPYKDKVKLLHFLFDGYDEELKRKRGIYIGQLGKGEYELEFISKLFHGIESTQEMEEEKKWLRKTREGLENRKKDNPGTYRNSLTTYKS